VSKKRRGKVGKREVDNKEEKEEKEGENK